ncbi:LacI family transcriptional regulator [Rhodoferax antarcticus]|uniref:Putative bacteriophage-related protein n=1 Tax=Rhodoferax antarcticus ANT.BR TaxID=1111071 RepID=A0A1Q8YBA2_9BURK|nr:LacI family transcriptional regulator [Rhodoferax antarcticus]APW46822.1 LacI family transcriptional regulator [Rhodoferax antarcticus]OLP05324.1 putative bacteriophage-related protein [Rhodoferax antarcticus ANT.BR]
MAKNDKGMVTGDPVTYQIPAPAGGVQLETFIPWTLVKRGVRRQVITPIDAPEQFEAEAAVERNARKKVKDSPSIRALGLAHYWQRLLDEGKYRSLTDIAAAKGMDRGQVSRTVQLTRLAPEIIESCFMERRGGPKLEQLARACPSCDWISQKSTLSNQPTKLPDQFSL